MSENTNVKIPNYWKSNALAHMGLVARKPVFGGLRTTQAHTPAHPRSLISVFVIHFLESTICALATGEISIC